MPPRERCDGFIGDDCFTVYFISRFYHGWDYPWGGQFKGYDILSYVALGMRVMTSLSRSSWVIKHYDTVQSTMISAASLLPHLKPGDKIAVTARLQTQGQGRRGRRWQSPDGNLYASIIMPLEKVLRPNQWGFAASYALVRSCIQLGIPPDLLQVKWPNDVLLEGGKVAGFLTEVTNIESSFILIMGVGVNVGVKPSHVPYPATCLNDYLQKPVSTKTVLSHFLTSLDDVNDMAKTGGFHAIRQGWMSHSMAVGHPITLTDGQEDNTHRQGIFSGIDDDGALVMTDDRGYRHRFLAGDMSLRPRANTP